MECGLCVGGFDFSYRLVVLMVVVMLVFVVLGLVLVVGLRLWLYVSERAPDGP